MAAAPDYCAIERKSISDFLGCIGQERARFEAELARFRAFPERLVLIEGSWGSVLNDPKTKLKPQSIAGTVAAWTARYCPFMFADNREMAEDFARRFLFNAARGLWERAEAFRKASEDHQGAA